MADIKMDFNGDVSIEKMFDIHDNQQVAIYNNSNTGKKENPNNPQEEFEGENFNIPSNVFCVTELHRTSGRSSVMLTIVVLAFHRMKKVLTNKNTKPSANSKEN